MGPGTLFGSVVSAAAAMAMGEGADLRTGVAVTRPMETEMERRRVRMGDMVTVGVGWYVLVIW